MGNIQPIICDGVRYHTESSGPNVLDHWKGFGGRHFTVIFKDGTVQKTDNLFMDFKSKEPDTADIYLGWHDARPEPRLRCRWHWYENLKMSFFVTEKEWGL